MRNERSVSITPNREKSNKSKKARPEPMITDNIYLRSLVKMRMIEEKKTKIKV